MAELWRVLGFTSLVMHAPAGDEKQLMLGALRSMFSEGHADVDPLLEEAEGYLAFVDVPKSDEIARKLERQLRALSDGEAPPGYVQEDLSELSKANHNRLEALEPGREKAKGYLLATVDLARAGADAGSCEAMCFFREEVPEDLVGEVVKGWKQAIRTQEERRGYMAEIFWNSLDHYEEADAVSHYRFIEAFGVGEFPKTLAEVEEEFRHALLAPATWVVGALNLWLASRSPGLMARVRPFAERALELVCGYQSPEGWWPRLGQDRQDEPTPADRTTALASVAIFRTSRDEGQLEQARAGARWLAGRQRLSGAWANAPGDDPWAKREEVHTALLAVEAVGNLDRAGFRATITAAEGWIMLQQSPSGLWRGETPLNPASMTVQAIERLENKRPAPDDMGDYLSIARDFSQRAREAALENSPNAWRLAVVVAFQGLEAFLYACLEHPSVNVPVFEGKRKGYTIGLKNALDRLEESLRGGGRLQGPRFPRRNHLDRLAYLRDEVVHKGVSVSRSEARKLTAEAARFMDEISETVFGFSLL